MRVLVAGATGVLGRALLPQLRAAGHETLGMARTPEKLLETDRLQARPVRGDVLDAQSMRNLMTEHRPQAIVNLATAIPLKLRVNPRDWEMNDRVRVEGTRNLLEAAAAVGVTLFVQESAGYVCRSQGNGWIDEEAPLSDHPFLRSTQAMEELTHAAGVPATLLRYGALVAAGSWHIQQSVTALRRRLLPVVGDGSAFISLIHVDDAAQAIVLALSRPQEAAGQTFNVVDDEPARMRDVWPYAAGLLKAPAPRHVSPMMAKIAVGALTVEVLAASYRISNGKIRQRLGFAPLYPSYRESWVQIAKSVAGHDFTPSADLH